MDGDAGAADGWGNFCVNLVAVGSLVLSLAAAMVSVTAMVVTMRNKVVNLEKRDAEQDRREERAAEEVKEVLVLIKSFIAEQTQINKTVEAALTGVIGQLREMEKRTIEASTVVSLLTEVLRKSEIKGLQVAP